MRNSHQNEVRDKNYEIRVSTSSSLIHTSDPIILSCMTFLHPTSLLAILIALTVHEFSHAYVARRLGDPTAEYEGRLTLNPIAHLDPLGTILMLMVGFGWAKPVPVNPTYFQHPKRDMMFTALAGPVSNLLLAILSFILLTIFSGAVIENVWDLLMISGSASLTQQFLVQFLASSLFINLGLMAFNLLPIAPLDGSKILQAFIPLQYEETYEEFLRIGPYLLLALLIGEQLVGLTILTSWIGFIMNGVLEVFVSVASFL
jgi:Zn-dependent protease